MAGRRGKAKRECTSLRWVGAERRECRVGRLVARSVLQIQPRAQQEPTALEREKHENRRGARHAADRSSQRVGRVEQCGAVRCSAVQCSALDHRCPASGFAYGSRAQEQRAVRAAAGRAQENNGKREANSEPNPSCGTGSPPIAVETVKTSRHKRLQPWLDSVRLVLPFSFQAERRPYHRSNHPSFRCNQGQGLAPQRSEKKDTYLDRFAEWLANGEQLRGEGWLSLLQQPSRDFERTKRVRSSNGLDSDSTLRSDWTFGSAVTTAAEPPCELRGSPLGVVDQLALASLGQRLCGRSGTPCRKLPNAGTSTAEGAARDLPGWLLCQNAASLLHESTWRRHCAVANLAVQPRIPSGPRWVPSPMLSDHPSPDFNFFQTAWFALVRHSSDVFAPRAG
ncbi:hypothetical protein L1887_51466 [Cichorium endivia]|nr:hypothetical protein L1887_51466 [Cichorium endivia]